jgi:cell division protein FtsL
LLFVGGLLVYVRQHLEVIRIGYRIEEVRYRRAQLLERQRHLVLERAYLRNPKRISAIARERLGLVEPPPEHWILLPQPQESAHGP